MPEQVHTPERARYLQNELLQYHGALSRVIEEYDKSRAYAYLVFNGKKSDPHLIEIMEAVLSDMKHLERRKQARMRWRNVPGGMLVCFENLENYLGEHMINFLEDNHTNFEASVAGIEDPVNENETELHLRMAEAAMAEYKATVVRIGEGIENTES